MIVMLGSQKGKKRESVKILNVQIRNVVVIILRVLTIFVNPLIIQQKPWFPIPIRLYVTVLYVPMLRFGAFVRPTGRICHTTFLGDTFGVLTCMIGEFNIFSILTCISSIIKLSAFRVVLTALFIRTCIM